MVRPYPISVDFEEINRDAQSCYVTEEMERLTDELNLEGMLVGLGIDRIDYTKGIPHRFRAMKKFFEKYPEFIGKVVFIQSRRHEPDPSGRLPATGRADRRVAGGDQ